ncbi:nuclear transport factor 2 (NTF2) superfamily protein [Bradyrhizobium sp. LM3.2]
MSRPPLPPFTRETAAQKARMAEDAWNSRDPVRVSLAYTEDSRWRNRSDVFQGREAIVAFLTRKWEKEQEYRLIKDLWGFDGNRIRGALPVRMARRERPMVSLLRQRAVGVRRARADEAARGLDQRHRHCGERPAVSLAGAGAEAGGCAGVGDRSVLRFQPPW